MDTRCKVEGVGLLSLFLVLSLVSGCSADEPVMLRGSSGVIGSPRQAYRACMMSGPRAAQDARFDLSSRIASRVSKTRRHRRSSCSTTCSPPRKMVDL